MLCKNYEEAKETAKRNAESENENMSWIAFFDTSGNARAERLFPGFNPTFEYTEFKPNE